MILTKSTKPTGHMNSKCDITFRKANLVYDMGIANVILYEAHGFVEAEIVSATIKYADGQQLGPVLCARRTYDGTVILTHISSKDGNSWQMTFAEEKVTDDTMPVYAYHQLKTALDVVSKQQAECVITDGDAVQVKIALSKAFRVLTQEAQRLEKKFPDIVQAANRMIKED